MVSAFSRLTVSVFGGTTVSLTGVTLTGVTGTGVSGFAIGGPAGLVSGSGRGSLD